MTQQATKKEYNSFIKGIITEAGALSFPEDASLDEENWVLNRDGSRQRRLGMDFEKDFVLRTITLAPDDALESWEWSNAANSTTHQLAVVQAGNKVMVFDAKAASTSAALIATHDLSAYTNGKKVLGTATGMGYFFIDTGASNPLYLSYSPTTGTTTLTSYAIKVRDIFGVDDGLAVNTEPSSLSTSHQYNLMNQGWDATRYNAYHTSQSRYPSNTQQWFVGKDSNDDFQPVLLTKQDFGTTPAPRGRFVIDAFDRSGSRYAASGVAVGADLEGGYPSTVAFGFQRIWHSGCISTVTEPSSTRPNYTGIVFYSRTVRDPRDFSQYYTDADPTCEADSELVDTDGGFVLIPDSGPIYRLIQKGSVMLVFAEKGIWMIGGDETGFKATAQSVNKLTEFGLLSAATIVDAEDSCLYWNKGGIYSLTPDGNGSLVAKNISEDTIQTLFNSLNSQVKLNAKGMFDPVNRRVTWLYNDEPGYDGVNLRHRYNKELVLDIILGAFYKNSISSLENPSPFIAGYLRMPDFLKQPDGVRTRGDSITKYLVVQWLDPDAHTAAISFSYYRDATFRDWKSLNGVGVGFLAYVITGYETYGDSTRRKHANYLFMHFQQTEKKVVAGAGGQPTADNPSGCLVQAQWDWANHPDSGKWGVPFQAYRLLRPYILGPIGSSINYGQKVVVTRNRLPGSGRALSLYITSDGDKDAYLYGWTIRATGESSV